MKSSFAIGFVLSLFCATALAQDGSSPSIKVTVSLQTGPTIPASKTDRAPIPVTKGTGGQELVAMSVLAVEQVQARVQRQRRIDYSADQIVIVGIAADGSERSRRVMIDPRLIRAEAIRGEDDLGATRFYRDSVDFPILLDDADVVEVRILKPRWNGAEWQFDTIGVAPLQ